MLTQLVDHAQPIGASAATIAIVTLFLMPISTAIALWILLHARKKATVLDVAKALDIALRGDPARPRRWVRSPPPNGNAGRLGDPSAPSRPGYPGGNRPHGHPPIPSSGRSTRRPNQADS